MFLRWLKFSTVGAGGILVQLAALFVFRNLLSLHYLWATGLAVECAILHNFVWHERWTWRERRGGWRLTLRRLVGFQLTTGLVSLGANLALMRLLAGWAGIHYLAANLLAIAITSAANFAVSEWFVFARGSMVRRARYN